MSGLMVQRMEYVPTDGESVSVDGVKLTATKVSERRVLELEVEALKR